MNIRWRRWRASLRDTLILLGEFRGPLLVFIAAIVGIGIIYFSVARQVGEALHSLPEAFYLMLTLAFLQAGGDFPQHPFLQIWYFILPVVGVATLAHGLADFGILLFNRRARNKEWEMAVASTFNNHLILVGLGHLGYRVVSQLHEMNEAVVVIEEDPAADLFAVVQNMGVPVIEGDASRQTGLEAAGVKRARTIVLCTQNDALNLQIALKARSLNPKIKVVVRIFNEDFAKSLHDQFGFTALSATGMAAPVFAAAAAGADVTPPITVEGQALSLARLTVSSTSALVQKTVGYIEDNYNLSIVLVRHDHQSEMHPTDSKEIAAGDVVAVLGGPQELYRLMHDNEG
jgi:Trk K+ transport system NAD-binding subunit